MEDFDIEIVGCTPGTEPSDLILATYRRLLRILAIRIRKTITRAQCHVQNHTLCAFVEGGTCPFTVHNYPHEIYYTLPPSDEKNELESLIMQSYGRAAKLSFATAMEYLKISGEATTKTREEVIEEYAMKVHDNPDEFTNDFLLIDSFIVHHLLEELPLRTTLHKWLFCLEEKLNTLYLFGTSNSGKSSFVAKILQRMFRIGKMNAAGTSVFAYSGLVDKDVIFFEEAGRHFQEKNRTNLDTMITLMEGLPVDVRTFGEPVGRIERTPILIMNQVDNFFEDIDPNEPDSWKNRLFTIHLQGGPFTTPMKGEIRPEAWSFWLLNGLEGYNDLLELNNLSKIYLTISWNPQQLSMPMKK
jgi:hypothetical protein